MNKRWADPLLLSLVGTAHAVEARLEAVVSPLGLSLAKVGILARLAEAGEPVPLHELAERERCVRSNITQLIDRLEHDGLVRRRADPTDRRRVRAVLTPEGERRYAEAVEALAREERDITSPLHSMDAANMLATLKLLAR